MNPFALKTAVFILITFVLISCDSMMYEYLNPEGGIFCRIPVKLDSSCVFEASIITSDGYLILDGLTGMHITKANDLHKLEMQLEIDGKILTPDEEYIEAWWLNDQIILDKNSCCMHIGDSLGASVADSSFGGSSVTVRYDQKYKSVTEFPAEVVVHLKTTASGGTADSTFTLKLKASKDTRAPIRFH